MQIGIFLVWWLFIFNLVVAGERDLRFENLSLEQGLSQSLVSEIHQDHRGFLWFGTQNGLNRYDGYQFKVYEHNPNDPDGLSNGYIVGLAEDQSKRLWVATFNGLNQYLPESDSFKIWRHDPENPNSIASDSLYGMIAAADGTLWMGSEAAGLTVLEPATMTFSHHRHDPENPRSLSADGVWCLVEDDRGRIWVGTDAGLDYYDPKIGGFSQLTLFDQGETPARIRALASVEGNLWVGTEGGGLFRVELNSLTLSRFRHNPAERDTLDNDSVLSLAVDPKGLIWVGTPSGLNKLNPRTGFVVRHRHNPTRRYSLGPYRIISLMQDRSDILWIGSNGGGVYKLTPLTEIFHHYTHDPLFDDSLGSPLVMSLTVDRDGIPWVGTFNKGFYRMNPKTGTFKGYGHDPDNPTTLSSPKVTALHEGVDRRLWIGTEGGVNRLDRKRDEVIRYGDRGLAGDVVVNFSDAEAGELWTLGMFGGPYVYLPGEDRFESRPLYDDGRQYYYSRIYHDPKGGQWIGTHENGLFYREDGELTAHLIKKGETPGIASNLVYGIYRDGSGILWVGGGAGLDRVVELENKPRFKNYSHLQGLPDNHVLGILPDRSGRLWLSTNRGISRFDPVKEVFFNFDVSDGLQSLEFNQGACFKSGAGEMYFGGINGFNVFAPTNVIENNLVPPVALTAFKKFNRDAGVGLPSLLEQVVLTHRDSVVSFEFAALDYTKPSRNRFAYMLEGFDEDWIQLGDKNDVTFTNLDPGRYKLHIKGSNSQGVWNHQGLVLNLRVIPPFWQTWWAYTFYVIAALGLLLAGHLFRVRELERRRHELALQVAERTTALQHKNEELETLDDIVRVINREVILEKLLQALLAEVMRLCPQADMGAFLMFDPTTARYKPLALVGFSREQEESLSSSEGLSYEDALKRYTTSAEALGGGVFIVKDIQTGVFSDALYYKEVPKSMIAMTVSLKDRPEGFLILDNLKDENGFDDSDSEVLIRLREHAVSAVAKARLVHDLVETGEQLKNTQQDLTEAAHYAGMAEIASGVLHNVGNALNSVNTSAELIHQMVEQPRIQDMITGIAKLLKDHEENLADFILYDDRGKKIPEAVHTVQKVLGRQFTTILEESENLREKIHQIHEVVAGQEQYTKVGFVEEVDLNQIIDNLIRIKSNVFDAADIQVVRDLWELPPVQTQKAKVMNILDHISKNARESLETAERPRTLTFRTRLLGTTHIRVEIDDTGKGIDETEIRSVFTHGFTTKSGAHGFGLHYCANAIGELGGKIHIVPKEGLPGACFAVEIPIRVSE